MDYEIGGFGLFCFGILHIIYDRVKQGVALGDIGSVVGVQDGGDLSGLGLGINLLAKGPPFMFSFCMFFPQLAQRTKLGQGTLDGAILFGGAVAAGHDLLDLVIEFLFDDGGMEPVCNGPLFPGL